MMWPEPGKGRVGAGLVLCFKETADAGFPLTPTTTQVKAMKGVSGGEHRR